MSLSRRHTHSIKRIAYGLCLLLIISATLRFAQPLPPITATRELAGQQAILTTPDLAWAEYGGQAVAVKGQNLQVVHGIQTPMPTASIAKLMTALGILHQHPFAVGEQGKTITLSDADVALYQQERAQGNSVVPVTSGEQITEHQALQAILLPSACNMANSIAIWAFGSMQQYLDYANQEAATLGMTHTHFAVDASGVSPQTVSTPQDLLLLAAAVTDQSVLMNIVSQSSATIPVAGTINNYDTVLGQAGIIGLKTGNNNVDLGAFLFAATYNSQTILGVTMGSRTLSKALGDSVALARSAEAALQTIPVVHTGQIVGQYKTPWGSTVNAIATKDVSILTWKGTQPALQVHLQPVPAAATRGQVTGSLHLAYGTEAFDIPVGLQNSAGSPSLLWRLVR